MNDINSDNELIRAANGAFGGHIRKGFLKRAQAALNRRYQRGEKMGRAEIFQRLENLPYRDTIKLYEETDLILDKMALYCDFADGTMYHWSNHSDSVSKKIDLLTSFIVKYGKKRNQKLLDKINYTNFY